MKISRTFNNELIISLNGKFYIEEGLKVVHIFLASMYELIYIL